MNYINILLCQTLIYGQYSSFIIYAFHHTCLRWSRGGGNSAKKRIIRGRNEKCITNFNPLKPNDPYRDRATPLTSKGCILYIYSTNICTEYFKHGIYSPFFSLQNAVCFIILTYLFPVLFTFYIQSVLKFKKKIIPAPKV
jgi:hypothetical protein